jgi:hypothetical protein
VNTGAIFGSGTVPKNRANGAGGGRGAGGGGAGGGGGGVGGRSQKIAGKGPPPPPPSRGPEKWDGRPSPSRAVTPDHHPNKNWNGSI